MAMVKAGRVRKILEDTLSSLNGLEDEDEVKSYGNTYGVEGHILEVNGGRGGYVNLSDIRKAG